MTPDIFYFDESDKKKVNEMYNRTEEMIEDDIEALENWVASQPHLPEIMDKKLIRNFLVLNKYSIEKAKQKIDMYYTIRGYIPELFADSNPKLPQNKALLETMCIGPHPKVFQGMYRVIFVKAYVPDSYRPREAAMQFINMEELRLHEDCMVGEVVVFDLSTLTINDMKKVTPSLLAKGIAVYTKVFSFRMKAIYFINSPSYITFLMTILKPIMKQKIFDRINVCPNDDILTEILSKSEIPEEYGGDGPSLKTLTGQLQQKFDAYQKRFDHLDTLKVDENARPDKLNNDEVLGFYGNFKKLSVD